MASWKRGVVLFDSCGGEIGVKCKMCLLSEIRVGDMLELTPSEYVNRLWSGGQLPHCILDGEPTGVLMSNIHGCNENDGEATDVLNTDTFINVFIFGLLHRLNLNCRLQWSQYIITVPWTRCCPARHTEQQRTAHLSSPITRIYKCVRSL